MNSILRIGLISAMGISVAAAQQASGAKYLIVHADDLAVAHAVDTASFAALDQRAASAASIMVPCPWLTEVAEYARAHPDADLGLHLTLTSEWKTYRWGPVASGNPGGLVDSAGYFPADAPPVAKNATADEVEREIRAQVERALKMGIHPTHLDSHMGTLFTAEFFPVYAKVAHEYGIPFLAPALVKRVPKMAAALRDTDALADEVIVMAMGVNPADWTSWYVHRIQALKPGLTEIIVHLGHDDAELQAITVGHPAFGSAWRQRDFEAITSPEFRKALADNHVTLIGWKDVAKIRQAR